MTAGDLGAGALGGIGAAGAAFGGLSAAVFVRLADAGKLRSAVRRMAADLLEMRMYLDEPRVVVRAQWDVVKANGRMLAGLALPLAVMGPLMYMAGAAMEGMYGRAPLERGEAAVVTAGWRGGEAPAGGATLRARGCVTVETPGVRVARLNEESWRIRATGDCAAAIEMEAGGRTDVLDVSAGSGWARARRYGGWEARLLDPLGERLGTGGVAWVAIGYRRAVIAGWSWPWWFTLFALAGGAAYAWIHGRWRRAGGVAMAALMAAGAARAETKTPVVLISIDTLRADHLGIYGYRKARTPNLDALARGGTVFDEAFCQAPLTLPSHASMFTSTYPFASGVEENAEVLPPGLETLAGVLKSHGYATAGFVGSAMLAKGLGLEAGFDLYDSPFRMGGSDGADIRVRRDGALVVRAAEAWMAAQRGAAFAFVHLFDLHTPYPSGRVEPEAGEYDARIEYVDRLVGNLRAALEKDGWWRKALVVLVSDHGEGLGDHGEASHGYFVYRSTVRVALIVHWPEGSARLGARVAEPVGLIDVAPGILEFLGIAAPSRFQGRSFLEPEKGASAISESVYARDQFGWAALRAAERGRWRYIEAPRPELYDVMVDPGEARNVAAAHPKEAAALRAELGNDLARYRPHGPTQAASGAKAALESLGYVAGGGKARESGADPKDRLGEYKRFESGLEAMYAGRLQQAETAFSAVLRQDATNIPARGDLGDCYRRAGRWDDASREWDEALRRDPKYAPAAEAMGEMWLERKQYEKARRAFERLIEIDARSYAGQFGLGVAEERLGRKEEARKHLKAACALEPNRAACAAQLNALDHPAR